MPQLLRIVRRAKWYKNSNVPWLQDGDLQADTLGDLKTQDNGLSVWYIEDDHSNLGRIAAAVSAGRDAITNFDYAIVDSALVGKLHVKVDDEPGDSPDIEANRTWHRNLTQFSHRQLFDFAELIRDHGEVLRMHQAEVLATMKTSFAENRLDTKKISEKIILQIKA